MIETDIIQQLDATGVDFEIAIENLERDFNMGTIVRTANAFGVRTVHVVGSRQWNKRGAMKTDAYLHIEYHPSAGDFAWAMHDKGKRLIAVENNVPSRDIRGISHGGQDVLIFGSEACGVSEELLNLVDITAHIPQLGSTRSINVGVAAGVAMWEWARTK
jgi:tRNA G18 (ribose-2'-O)-methylase SpoU